MSASSDKSAPSNPDLPERYLDDHGQLVIPFAADPESHWWKPGGIVQKVETPLERLLREKEND